MLYQRRTIGGNDWYAWGKQSLIARQRPEGNWTGGHYQGSTDTIDTCFALLFLKRSDLAADLTASLNQHGSLPTDDVPELIAALADPDAKVRAAAAGALSRLGKNAAAAVPELMRLVSDKQQPSPVRVEAAEALSNMNGAPEMQEHVPVLLKMMANADEDTDVRARIAWMFNGLFSNLPVMEKARPFMEIVCAEAPTKKNGMVRYQSAYLLALRFPQKAPDSTIDVLAAWLHDNTGQIYSGKDAGGKLNVTGDSRSMALQAIGSIGRNRIRAQRHCAAIACACEQRGGFATSAKRRGEPPQEVRSMMPDDPAFR